jgi:hypothetical protein
MLLWAWLFPVLCIAGLDGGVSLRPLQLAAASSLCFSQGSAMFDATGLLLECQTLHLIKMASVMLRGPVIIT